MKPHPDLYSLTFSADDKLVIFFLLFFFYFDISCKLSPWWFFLIFPRKQDLTFHANCLQRQTRFLGKIRKITKCHLLKILYRVLNLNWCEFCQTLRKHAYSNKLKILPPKKWKFQIKILTFFHISAQNIDCGYLLELPHRGGSNEYSQSMFLSRYKKNNVYPGKPQFYYIKVGFKGVNII